MIGDRQNAPDFLEPVIGFRIWQVENGKLWSPYVKNVAWQKVMNAECEASDYPNFTTPLEHNDPPPGHNCRCGLYAFYHLSSLRRHRNRGEAIGAVQLWGKLEAHNTGVRSQYAAPVALAKLPLVSLVKVLLIWLLVSALPPLAIEFISWWTIPLALPVFMVAVSLSYHYLREIIDTLVENRSYRRAAKEYGLPLVKLSKLERKAEEFGKPFPRGLLKFNQEA